MNDMETETKVWEEILEEEWDHYDLLMDYPQGKRERYYRALYSLGMEKQPIKKFCIEIGCCELHFFCAILHNMLAAFAYQEDIMIGVIEDYDDTKQDVLLIRNRVDRTLRVADFIKMIESRMNAFRREASAVQETVKRLPEYHAKTSLYDVIFRYQKMGRNGNNAEFYKVSEYGLEIVVSEENDSFQVNIYYGTELYKYDTIEKIADCFKRMVERSVVEPNACLKEIGAPSDEELFLLRKWNHTTVAHSYTNQSFCGILEEQAKRIPDKIALVYGSRKVTYWEFFKQVEALASHLVELGVGVGDFVAIYAERSIEMIVAIYAVLRAKAVYVPLSPMYDQERIQYILEDCKPKTVLTYGTKLDCSLPMVNLTSYSYIRRMVSLPDTLFDAEDCIYCIYTSGTTGNPKGVMNYHRGLLNVIQWMQRKYPLGEEDAILQKTTYVFDVSASEIFWFSLEGATLVIAEPGAEKDPNRMIELIATEQVTVIDFVPSMLSIFLQIVDRLQGISDKLKSLKYVFAAGEALNREVVNQFYRLTEKKGLHTALVNIYGPTEASIYSAFYACEPDKLIVPIGKPIDNVQLYVERDGVLCGIGVPGELCIAGMGVAKGYLNLRELTDQVFQENPYGAGSIYHSGDLVRWMADGNIEYLGRMDSQVKVRGYRIELGEVEAAFRKIKGIKDVAVIVKEDQDGDKMLYAYYVADYAWPLLMIREELEKHLPLYMLPSYITYVEEIPVTANGKLNRRKLAEIKVTYGNVYVEPKLIEEKVVCEIIGSVLNRNHISIHDSFIGLGGDSIKAIKVMSKLRDNGYDTTLACILGRNTIEELAKELKIGNIFDYEQGECTGVVLPTPIIQTFLNWDLKKPEHYNQSVELYIDEDPDDICDVLNAMYEHHDVLRAVFRDKELHILSISESEPIEVEVVELNSLRENREWIDEKKREINESFFLEEGPLLKAAYFMASDQSYLFLCAHHLIMDGVSWRIMIEDLLAGLKLLAEGKDISFPAKTASYLQWAELVDEYRKSAVLQDEVGYWKSVENEARFGKLSFVQVGDTRHYEEQKFEFSQEITEQLLVQAGFAYGTSINDLLLAALGYAVYKISGQEYVAVGVEGHGREELHMDIKMDRTIGWFTSIYPVVLQNQGTIQEQIITTKERLRRVPKNGIGYGMLHSGELLDVDICFNYLGRMEELENGISSVSILDGISVASCNQLPGTITFNGEVCDERLCFTVAWDNMAVSKNVMEELIASYQTALTEIIQCCVNQKESTKTISDYSAEHLTEEELQDIKKEYPEVEDILPVTPLQEGILFHCRLHPETTAYQIQAGFTLEGAFDFQRFESAVGMLSQHHSTLRTIFMGYVVKEPYQIVLKELHLPIEYKDCSSLSKEKQEAFIAERLADDQNTKFILERGPLVRMLCFKIAEKQHICILSFHHLVMDGWSIGNFMSELKAYYEDLEKYGTQLVEQNVALARNKNTGFAQYCKVMVQKGTSKDRDYWHSLLMGFDGGTSICSIANIQEEKRETRKVVSKGYGIAETRKINGVLATHNLTMSNLTEAAWSVLLAKYNRSEEVLFGKMVSGREIPLAGIEQMIGMFVNTIPVRMSVSGKERFLAYMKQVQEQSNESMMHAACSLPDILKEAGLEANQLNTLFVFESDPSEEVEEAESFTYKRAFVNEETDYALTLRVGVYNGSLTVELLYQPSMYHACEVEHILANYVAILEQFIREQEITVEQIVLPGKDDAQKIFQKFNDSSFEFDRNRTIIEMFEEQVQLYPEQIAVVFAQQKLSYLEFHEKVNVLAGKLLDIGITKNDFIVILAKRSVEMVLAVYGVLKAGAAYVPVDVEYPMDRIQFILEDCKPKAILTYHADVKLDTKIPTIDLADQQVFEGQAREIVVANEGTDAIYCIYTSGTTGRPKGVVNQHNGLMNLVAWMQKEYPLEPGDCILQKTTYVFDVSASELLWWSTVGATLVIAEPQIEKEPFAILDIIDRENIAMIDFVPSMLSAFLESISGKDGLDEKWKNLKYVIVAGEALTTGLVEEFYRLAGEHGCHAILANIYGPTEASIYSTYYNCHPNMETVPIGKPVGNVKVYIMQDGSLCGIGVPGELCIAGAGVSKGYLHLEALTEERFIDNPYGEGKLYRSGDLAYWNFNGDIEYLGRMDSQVKIRGFRIELGEVETAIRKIHTVKNCAVIMRKDSFNENALFGYVVSDETLDITLLKEQLKAFLPDYMIPGYIMQIEQIPTTVNGKLNRRLLPDIVIEGRRDYVAPRNRVEQKLCEFYQEVLGVERVGVCDDFFELGGHSLRATRLVNRIQLELCQAVNLSSIFKYSAVEDLAKWIASIREQKEEEIPRAGYKEYYPMSSSQKRVFLVTKLDPDGITYNIPQNFKVKGTLKIEKLREAYAKVVKRHEILRTNFMEIQEQMVQVIHEEANLDFTVQVDEESSEESLLKGFVQPFDLQNGALIRMKVVLRREYALLLFDMHHIITDGVSLGLFWEELSKEYNGTYSQQKVRQYKDYSEWMNNRAHEKEKEYWIGQFRETVPILNIPTDYRRPMVQRFRGDLIRWEMDHNTLEQVQKLVRQTGLTEYMVYLSSLMILLNKYSREEDIVIGSPVSGRVHEDTERMIGMFVNTLAMRAFPKREKTCLEFMKEVKEVCFHAYEHQEYPFEELIEQIDIFRDFTRNPLFDVLLSVQNYEEQKLVLDGLECEQLERRTMVSKFDLTFNVYRRKEKSFLEIEYDTDLYCKETITWMGKHFLHVLKQMFEHPNQTIGELTLLTPKEEEQILYEFSGTVKAYDKNKTIVDLFAEQVKAMPDQIAVTFRDKSMTYAQVEKKVDALAARLKERGVGTNDFVVLYAARSIEMFLGILAVLKAGGAYVPVDPEWPEKRVEFILKDCRPKVALVYERQLQTEIPILNMAEEATWAEVCEPLVPISRPQDLAYLIYTSGTTGTPKGVMIAHKGIMALCCYLSDEYRVTRDDQVLQFSKYVFDASVWEWVMAFAHGATLVIVPEEVIYEEEMFANFVKEKEISIALLPPQYYLQIPMEGIRILTTGGSASNYEVVEKSANNKQYINAYGPTENTVLATGWEHTGTVIPDAVPIGKPIPNTRIYILDEMNLCGIGIPGELCIAGESLANGYLNLPKLTKEKFIENPYGEGMLYRSGDLARWLPDGNIAYMGRLDEQVKIRGFRIELGEIEAVLRKTDGVKDCAVHVFNEQTGGVIGAYVVSNIQLNTEAVRNALRQFIPEYMVPSYILQIEKIPVTSSGKVDYRALLELQPNMENDYVPPQTEMEALICEMFEKVLGKEKVSVYDSFYELGGDSIKAIRIISKLRSRGYAVSNKDIMRFYTPSAIALAITRIRKTYSQEEVTGVVPFTPVFREFFSWKFKKPEHFNQSVLLPVQGVTEEMVKQVLERIVSHYDMLRLVYRDKQLLILSTEESKGFEFRSYDIRTERHAFDVMEKKCNEQQESMDLEHGPILKSILFQTGEGDYLFLCIHHFAVDGVSWRVLIHDLNMALENCKNEKEIKLSEKTASFIEWAEALNQYAGSEQLQKQLPYWEKVVEESLQSEFSYVDENPEFIEVDITLDEEETDVALYGCHKTFDTKPQELFLTALGAAMHEQFGKDAVIVFLEGHGREAITADISVENTVGWFTSIYPVCIPCGTNNAKCITSIKEMLRQVPDGGIGYGLIKEQLRSIRPQIYFNYLGEMDNENEMKIGIGNNIAQENRMPYLLSFNGYVIEKQLTFTITMNSNWLDKSSIEAFSDLYRKKINEIAKYCSNEENGADAPINLEGFELEQDDLDTILSMIQEDI